MPATATKGPSFSIPKEDTELIAAIIQRLESKHLTLQANRMDHFMDLTACHANGCPLQLQAMLDWPEDFDLMHDVAGINRHIDRATGKLTDCFLPRFAA